MLLSLLVDFCLTFFLTSFDWRLLLFYMRSFLALLTSVLVQRHFVPGSSSQPLAIVHLDYHIPFHRIASSTPPSRGGAFLSAILYRESLCRGRGVVVQPHLCNVLGTCFWCSGESVALNSCRLYGGSCAAEAMKRSHERYIVKDSGHEHRTGCCDGKLPLSSSALRMLSEGYRLNNSSSTQTLDVRALPRVDNLPSI